MNAHLLRLVAIAGSTALLLPPGWCSSFAQPEAPVAVQNTCCHPSAPAPASGSHQSPVRPGVRCCCSQDAAFSRTELQPDAPSAVLPDVVDHPTTSRTALHAACDIPRHHGPALHVLQCVWLC